MYDFCFKYNWKGIEEIVWILHSAFILCVFKSEKDKGKVDEVKVWYCIQNLKWYLWNLILRSNLGVRMEGIIVFY